jgi:ribosomal protein L37AE/L43A
MNSFDDIPENDAESYPCSKCHNGNVTQNIITGVWECDKCDFSAKPNDDEE